MWTVFMSFIHTLLKGHNPLSHSFGAYILCAKYIVNYEKIVEYKIKKRKKITIIPIDNI